MTQMQRFLAPSIDASRTFLRQHPSLRRMLRPYLRRLLGSVHLPSTETSIAAYRRWIEDYDTPDQEDRLAIRHHIAALSNPPLISVVLPVCDASEALLRQAIASVRMQLYPNWELCIAADASTARRVVEILQRAASEDFRIRWIQSQAYRHLSAVTNCALGEASGAWVALLHQSDILSERALYEVSAEILAHPNAQMIYSDEDRIDETGKRFAPFFKPDFDPDLLLGLNYVRYLSVYRHDLMLRLGRVREDIEGSQDHDYVLRATAAVAPAQVRHVPAILYHRRLTGTLRRSAAIRTELLPDASRRAVRDALTRCNVTAEVTSAPLVPQLTRVIWPLPNPAPLVSVIVPTRDQAALLRRCLEGVLQRTSYAAIEVLVVDNGSEALETMELLAELEQDTRVRVLTMPGPFNYAKLNNRAAAVARGQVLLLLNNDVEVIHDGWLREMVSHAVRPDVGAVGAKLLYTSDKLQHGGTVLGIGGVAGHYRTGASRSDAGPFGTLALCRSTSAVTAACMAVRRAVFDEVGGLNQAHLAVAFNDVDLCLRLRDRGYRNVWTPFAELYHMESVSRGRDQTGEAKGRFEREQCYMLRRWSDLLKADPYWNPNLSLADLNGALACPPRQVKRWRRQDATAAE